MMDSESTTENQTTITDPLKMGSEITTEYQITFSDPLKIDNKNTTVNHTFIVDKLKIDSKNTTVNQTNIANKIEGNATATSIEGKVNTSPGTSSTQIDGGPSLSGLPETKKLLNDVAIAIAAGALLLSCYGFYLSQSNIDADKFATTVNASSSDPIPKKSPFRFQIPIPTRHFVGRNQTMEAIQDYFAKLPQQPTDCWGRMVTIVGLGGMGKTETAYKFAAKYEQTYPSVAWIDASTQDSLLRSFLGLAKDLMIVSNVRESADVEVVKQVYRHIDQNDYGQVLFIFDNAIRLNSGSEEFGIMEYLPTDDLTNNRFPYVLITTQTQDWERAKIKKFQIDELSEEESLEFFRSAFPTESDECDDLFNKLYKLLEGYPLVMNLAASQIDFDPDKPSVRQLKQQINNYIQNLEEKQDQILKAKINHAWPTKYNKTLSSVWHLTFERIQQEEKGADALELLHLMSFLHAPIYSGDVLEMLLGSSDCPDPSYNNLSIGLKDSVRVLERFYAVRIRQVHMDDDNVFSCDLGIHPLVQLAVRQLMDSSKGIERFLLYFAKCNKNGILNKSALEEALLRSQLSHRALPYLGVLACRGFPVASQIVGMSQLETKAAATIWRLCNLERGMTTLNWNAIPVLRDLLQLTQSEERLEDRQLFGDITMDLLVYENHFQSARFDGTEVLPYFSRESLEKYIAQNVGHFILSFRSVQDLSCNSDRYFFDREKRDYGLSVLTAMHSKMFSRKNISVFEVVGKLGLFIAAVTFLVSIPPPISSPIGFIVLKAIESNVELEEIPSGAHEVSRIWFALFARMTFYDTDKDSWPQFLVQFWDEMYTISHGPDATESRIVNLRKTLWDLGLARSLIEMLDFFSRRFKNSFGSRFKSFLLKSMDFCMDGMDLRDERVQEVISAFFQMTTTIEKEFISKDHRDAPDEWTDFAVELSSVCVKLFLMDDNPPSPKLLESLSRLKFLDWMERSPKFDSYQEPFFRC